MRYIFLIHRLGDMLVLTRRQSLRNAIGYEGAAHHVDGREQILVDPATFSSANSKASPGRSRRPTGAT